MEFNRYLCHYDDGRIMIVMMIFTMIRLITMIKMMITMMITNVRFRSMEDLGGKQEKTAGWELVRLLRFDHHYEDEVVIMTMIMIMIMKMTMIMMKMNMMMKMII